MAAPSARAVAALLLGAALVGYLSLWLRLAAFVADAAADTAGGAPASAPGQRFRSAAPPPEEAGEAAAGGALAPPPAGEAAAREGGAWVQHDLVLASNGLFASLRAYVIDNGADLGSPSAASDHLVAVLAGVGEFGAVARRKGKGETLEAPLEVPPLLECVFRQSGARSRPVTVRARVHINGTAYTNERKNDGSHKFIGERGVLISCPLGLLSARDSAAYGLAHGSLAGTVEVRAPDGSFSTRAVEARYFVSDVAQRHELVECSAGIHDVTGSQWVLEWIEYHLAIGFEHLHLYLCDAGADWPLRPAIDWYVAQGLVTAHDWSRLCAEPGLGKVVLYNWESAQRLARQDCFLRSRGAARYVAFSDVDELWSLPGRAAGELVQAGQSFFAEGAEGAGAGTAGSGSAVAAAAARRWLAWFEQQHRADPRKVAFQFKSVTLPPLSARRVREVEGGELLVPLPRAGGWRAAAPAVLEDEQGLLLGVPQLAELRCEKPYNCGLFHFGRQKYMLRTARGSLNPNAPMFYHGVNEDYEALGKPLSRQVPGALGMLRHYAGHFSHSRLGGLLPNNRQHLPLPAGLLRRLRRAIDCEGRPADCPLARVYRASPPEALLRLDRGAEDLFRFAKPSDDVAAAAAARAAALAALRAARARQRRAFLTLTKFPARLNNQLLTMDWAFRIAHGLGRTLLWRTDDSGSGQEQEKWIGLPESAGEEAHGTSLWDMPRLRERFQFLTDYDVAASHGSLGAHPVLGSAVEQLDPACVWRYALVAREPRWKNIAVWAHWADAQPQCALRIHVDSSDGLVHPYRTDTRFLGVGPLDFWAAMRPSAHLVQVAQGFLRAAFQGRPLLGMHARSHNSNGPREADKGRRTCKRLEDKPVAHTLNRIHGRAKLCVEPSESDPQPAPPIAWPSYATDIEAIFKQRRLADMCDIQPDTVDYALRFARRALGTDNVTVFLATDHENAAVDELVYRIGGKSYEYAPSAVYAADANRAKHPGEARSHMPWRDNIQGVLLDMLMLSMVDVFFGNPGSTLTQTVCMWRLSDASEDAREERSNTCGLVLMATGAGEEGNVEC